MILHHNTWHHSQNTAVFCKMGCFCIISVAVFIYITKRKRSRCKGSLPQPISGLFYHVNIRSHRNIFSTILLGSPVILHLRIKLFLCLLGSSIPSKTLSTAPPTTTSVSPLSSCTWSSAFSLTRTRAAGTTASAWNITIDVAWWRPTNV